MRGMLAGAGAVGGIVGVATMFRESLNDMAAHAARFEDELTPLLSLGNNMGNIDAIRASVLGMSGAWGIATADIAAAQYQLQSSTANLSATIRDDLMRESIKLNKLTGTDLRTAVTGLSKTWQNYGNEVGNVARLSGMLAFAADEAVISFEELGNLMPDLLPVAKLYGITLEELIATLSTATLSLGKNDKTFTGVRNVILRMNKATEEGIDTSGRFIDVLERMNSLPKEQMQRIFGDEAISVISTLAARTDQIEQSLQKINALPADLVGGKLAMRGADPTYATTQIVTSANQIAENVDAVRMGRHPELRAVAERQSMVNLGAQVDAYDWVPKRLRDWNAAMYQMWDLLPDQLNPFQGRTQHFAQVGVEVTAGQFRKQGRNVEADALELANMGIVDLGPGKGKLSDDQMRDLRNLRNRGTAGGDEAAMRRAQHMMPGRFVTMGQDDADLLRLANAASAAGAKLDYGPLGEYLTSSSAGGQQFTKSELIAYRGRADVDVGEVNATLAALRNWANQQTPGGAGSSEQAAAIRENTKALQENTRKTGNPSSRPPVNRYGQAE
jgi:hypothetical protein